MSAPGKAHWARWLTGKGPGALSVVQLGGPKVWEAIRQAFQSSKQSRLPELPSAGSAWLGSFPDAKQCGDQVLLLWRGDSKKGFAEIQSHHGILADQALAQRLASMGIEVTNLFEDQDSGHFADASTLFEREKLRALAMCPNHTWLNRILTWADRDWPRAVEKLFHWINNGNWTQARDLVQSALLLEPWSTRMVKPFEVLISGPPNAGKSSLLNRLVGYDRAIVSTIPGTTRDLVSGQIALKGWLVNLTDSAGVRETDDPIESQGIERVKGQMLRADAVIWVTDPLSDQPSPSDWGNRIEIANKIEVANKVDLRESFAKFETNPLSISAKTGLGVDQLLQAMSTRLGLPDFPLNLPIPFTIPLSGCLQALLDLIQKEKDKRALEQLCQLGVPLSSKEF